MLPILLIYRKYYGTAFTARITALMFAAMIGAALIVGGIFEIVGLVPDDAPGARDIFGTVGVDYKLALNALAPAIFAALIAMTVRRGATDPVCGMTVDRAQALTLEVAGGRSTSARSTAATRTWTARTRPTRPRARASH